MNDTLKTIVGLVESGKPELQVAAAQVLGELRAKDPSAVRALSSAVRRSPVLGRFSLEALSKIQTEEALATIVGVAVEPDSLGDHAAHLLADVGGAAHAMLAESYPQAAIEQRTRILTILARQLSRDGIQVFVHALLTPETTVVAARLLLAAADQFSPALQKQLRDGLGKHLDSALPDACLAQVVAVLAKVDAEGSKALLMRLIEPQVAPLVRSAAFRAMQGTRLGAAQVRSMLDLLENPAEKGVHDAVREVLALLPEVPEAMLPVLKRLLAARQPEQRLFALRMLRTAGGADLARISLKLLDHEDERFRRAAIEALAHNRQAIEPVLRLVLTSKNPTLAQTGAEILARHGSNLAPKLVRAIAEKALKLLSGNPRVADLLLDVVLSTGAAKLAPFMVERCIRLRRVSRHADAMHVLARITAATPGDDEVRYQLALTKLLYDGARPVTESAVPGNSTMGFLAALLRGEFPVFDRLRKEASVTPDLLLRVATHFQGAVGPERRFATEMLQHLAARTKGRAGDEARVALRAVGG
jgi:HEAT repeat protein